MRDIVWRREALRRREVVSALGLGGLTLLLQGCLTQSDVQQLVTAQNINALMGSFQTSEADERQIGNALYGPTIDASGGTYRNPGVQRAMQSFAQPLFRNSTRPNLPWEITVLDDNSVNAWALPSGKIGVNKGLLRYVDSDAELAAVIGHEMGHVEGSHAVNEMSAGRFGGNVTGILRDFGANKAQQASAFAGTDKLAKAAIDQLREPLISLVTSGYSRSHELAADENILRVFGQTGYDPRRSYTFFERLLVLIPPGTDSTTSLYSKHPETRARIDALRTASAKTQVAGAPPASDAFGRLKRTFPTRTAPPALASA
jgi:beta-barrel assembly-enhancing protease